MSSRRESWSWSGKSVTTARGPTICRASLSYNNRKGMTMKISGLILFLAAAVSLVPFGCTDDPVPIVGTTEAPDALGKLEVIHFTATESLIGHVSPGEVKIVGGRMIITGMVDRDRLVASSPYVDGEVLVTFNASFDANMEGPVHGTYILTPTEPFGGGVWQGTFTGYQRMTGTDEWTVYARQVAHGRGGSLEGMKHMANSVYVNGIGFLTGEIKVR